MKYIDELIERRKILEPIKVQIINALEILKECYKNGNKVLICGNGGSAADAAHITGELMKSFKKKRFINSEFEKELKKVIDDFTTKNKCNKGLEKISEMKEVLEPGLPTIDLTSFISLNTAFSNDKNGDYAFANEILGLGNKGDVLFAITTSGMSKNVINACLVAKAKELKIIGLTGKNGGKISNIADVNIVVPLNETYLIQEEHIAIYHTICLELEETFFN